MLQALRRAATKVSEAVTKEVAIIRLGGREYIMERHGDGPSTGITLRRRYPKVKGKAAVKAHKRLRARARRAGLILPKVA